MKAILPIAIYLYFVTTFAKHLTYGQGADSSRVAPFKCQANETPQCCEYYCYSKTGEPRLAEKSKDCESMDATTADTTTDATTQEPKERERRDATQNDGESEYDLKPSRCFDPDVGPMNATMCSSDVDFADPPQQACCRNFGEKRKCRYPDHDRDNEMKSGID